MTCIHFVLSAEQSALYNERVYMSSSNTLLDKDSLCLESQTGFRPSESEYKVLIRSGEACFMLPRPISINIDSRSNIRCFSVIRSTYIYLTI